MGGLAATLMLFVSAYGSQFQYANAFSLMTPNFPPPSVPSTSFVTPFVSVVSRPAVDQNRFRLTPTSTPTSTRSTTRCYGVSVADNDNDYDANDSIVTRSKCGGKQSETRLPATVPTSMSRRRAFAKSVLRRCDTFRAAGLYDPNNPPLVAGGKTNFVLFCLAFGYKCYRSIFINKMAVWERQPQWNTVMTSREMEIKANLKTMSCKTCGTTIFIAKGRKWFQMPKDYECYGCGTKGVDNFVNVRDELLDEIDDDYFDYEKPLDFVTAAERRSLMKQAGGDETKANALLQGISEEDIKKELNASGEVGEKKKKKKKKKGKKKKKTATDDVIPEEGADAKASSSSDTGIGDTPDETSPSDGEKNSEDSLDDLDMDDF